MHIGFTLLGFTFDGIHAFWYNSTESGPVWMKSGALWWQCLGLALADFERDLRSSEIRRARQNFGFLSCKQCTILLLSRQPNFTKFAQNTWRWIL